MYLKVLNKIDKYVFNILIYYKKMKKPTVLLERFYDDENKYEISIDEAGRGCLFGRVYIACVVLPKDSTKFDGTNIKDSKKFSSKKGSWLFYGII